MTNAPDLKRLRTQLKREGQAPLVQDAGRPEVGWWTAAFDLAVPGLGHLIQKRGVAGVCLIVATYLFWDYFLVNFGLRIGSAISALAHEWKMRR